MRCNGIALAVVAVILISSCANASPRSGLQCNADASQRAADLARAAVPDSVPPHERRLRRTTYLVKHQWQLFDTNHDGRLTFDEYRNIDWSNYLSQLPAGDCTVTKKYFMSTFLGYRNDPNNFWRQPYLAQVWSNIYDELDKSKKGYLTREDLREWSRSSFQRLDRFHRGYLTPDDLP